MIYLIFIQNNNIKKKIDTIYNKKKFQKMIILITYKKTKYSNNIIIINNFIFLKI